MAILQQEAPTIFARRVNKEKTFICSTSFTKKFVHETLGWSYRKVTRAAQKIPEDAAELCQASICRQALAIRNHSIPAACRINIDQTQVVIAGGNDYTYETIGSSQVSAVGHEEKRAFTVVVGIAASGDVLPFQVVWKGMTSAVLPKATTPHRRQADEIGIQWVPSGTRTYWSTFETMCSYVNDIVAPYSNDQKERLGLPQDQECILQLDVWSVHRGKEFVDWITKTHPSIIRDYVPGGCTGIFQPCDVGIQKLFKAAVRCRQHEDIIEETLQQLKQGIAPDRLRLDTQLGTLRDRSVRWLVEAYNAINKPEIVLKVSQPINREED